MRNTTWTQRAGMAVVAALITAALTLAGCTARSSTSSSGVAGSSATGGMATQASNSAPPAPPGGAGGGSSTAKYTPTGAYTVTTAGAAKTGAISASENDQSGVLVSKNGSLTLSNAAISTTGKSSSADESSFYGLNAGVLVQNGGKLVMTGGSIKTTGAGANDLFAYGTGSAITLSGTSMTATGQYAHGIMASGGGSITATNLNVFTTGGSSAPIATDRGGGTIVANGGTYKSTGNNSPAIYSTGAITTNGGTYLATGSEVVVIEGANSTTLNSSALTSSKAGKWGVMIYQSMSGDASGAKGVYTQTGGSLTDTAADSPLFYVTNTTGVITLKGVKVSSASSTLVNAAAGQWGTSGANGGTVILTANAQALAGSIVADKVSSVGTTLKNGSTLSGAINSANTAKVANLVLDSTSRWTVMGNSHLTGLTGAQITGTTITNIVGNGYTVSYDKSASANSSLGGKTYQLAGGGTLVAQ